MQAFHGLELSAEDIPTDGEVEISCLIRNTGDRTGAEIVQLYTGDPVAQLPCPVIQLNAFVRVLLAPDEERRTSPARSAASAASRSRTHRRTSFTVGANPIGVAVNASPSQVRVTNNNDTVSVLTPSVTLATTLTAAPAEIKLNPVTGQFSIPLLTATLKETVSNNPVVGQTVTFTAKAVGGPLPLGSATTNGSGVATRTNVVVPSAIVTAPTYTAAFAGAPGFGPSSSTASLTFTGVRPFGRRPKRSFRDAASRKEPRRVTQLWGSGRAWLWPGARVMVRSGRTSRIGS
ncbi:fibronectin type III-like domain-contianing protein [Streptomyces sp. NBRC 110028]|uniref:fibronectin type III-like domain-contianing protein n=1 Tax=Streptomyces sp. NBRC 110028 TaxID=1621260 RepID=UPI0006E1CD72|nr:fibronectin type III-like domain-contianing protein [Streptomyces sp. NBRC 110028]